MTKAVGVDVEAGIRLEAEEEALVAGPGEGKGGFFGEAVGVVASRIEP